MPTLDDVNKLLACGVDSFHFHSFEKDRLVLIGTFDICYYHNVELTFTGVEFIRCPTSFYATNFRNAGPRGEGLGFEIETDEGTCEIVAESLTIEIGIVYYYDRGDQLLPGERIASWVQRAGDSGGT